MLNPRLQLASISTLAFGVLATACGAPAAPRQPAATSAAAPAASAPVAAPAPAAEPAPAPPPQESPGFAASMASLRPAGTESALQRLVTAPGEPEAYAQAALAYAPTEVPGMTLLWGMSYQGMGGGASDAAIAKAFSQVLTERILAKPDAQQQVTFNLRLAPGQMPVRQLTDGSSLAPIAYAFEALLSPAVTGFRPPWTIEQYYDVLSNWVGLVATHGTPLDELVELNGWLVMLAKAGHLEAFCHQLLGPAFPAELKSFRAKNLPALKAYAELLKTSPLRPHHAVMPDELVRVQ